ncbi:MAG: hypothetical protein MJ214_03010 [Bacilli bacterium]|nr:hypothetical protein [Bacilli bacterium]
MKRNYVFVCLLSIPFLFNCGSGNRTFVFKSDYCTLDNNDSYQNNTKVDLTLKIVDEYKDAYVMPDDIEVLLGNKTGILNEDYQYTIGSDKISATLSLTISDNVVVRVMYSDSDNVHRVTEEQFNKAMAMENIPYIQHEYEFYRYYYRGATTINLNRIDYISPNVNYQFVSNIIDSGGIEQVETEPKYYSKDNEGKKCQYNYDKNTKTWSKYETEQEQIPFYVSNDVSPRKDETISSYLTYDKLKDNYNYETSLYSYEAIEQRTSQKYTITLSFDKNRLMSLSYETFADEGYLCYVTYSYLPIVPELPTPVSEL